MTNDEAEYDARRQVRAQADADVAAFIESLGQDEGAGIPPPVRINITDVSTKPVKFSPFAFGREDSAASPGPKVPPSSVPWACCLPDNSCEMLSAADCAAAGGTFHINQTCDPNPCLSPCDINTIELSVAITGKICLDSEPSGGYSASKTFHRVTGTTGADEFSLEDCILIGPNDNGGFGSPPGRFEWDDGTLHPFFALIPGDAYSLNTLERVGYCTVTISTGMAWSGFGTFSFPISGTNINGTPWSGTVTLVAS